MRSARGFDVAPATVRNLFPRPLRSSLPCSDKSRQSKGKRIQFLPYVGPSFGSNRRIRSRPVLILSTRDGRSLELECSSCRLQGLFVKRAGLGGVRYTGWEIREDANPSVLLPDKLMGGDAEITNERMRRVDHLFLRFHSSAAPPGPPLFRIKCFVWRMVCLR